MKVGEFELHDAIELLLLRSRLGAAGETSEARIEAAEIVKELAYLPLAIEQAGAYIREASRDLFKFLPSYRKDRKNHHARLSKGNRNYYSGSVSTTWHLSFQKIEQNNSDATKILRLLSFLNPDGILTDFLSTGKEGLSIELAEIVSQDDRLNEALAELERFSLIGRQEDISGGQRITIHRLVQSVIKDDMLPDIFSIVTEDVIGLCESAFPYFDYNVDHELRLRGRRFRDQMIMPLLSIYCNSREFGKILHRIGVFLRDDGNFQQAIELLAKAMDILEMIGESEDLDTLDGM
ncbi:MAG TPA: tetratricopeptide repeat protein, partial [Bacteroidota bacterium]|nr:tetratricopeptide repeat protein [Bacteroidota bacterium]